MVKPGGTGAWNMAYRRVIAGDLPGEIRYSDVEIIYRDVEIDRLEPPLLIVARASRISPKL